jgi:hypothetical protein
MVEHTDQSPTVADDGHQSNQCPSGCAVR